jgi:hypothetical protein
MAHLTRNEPKSLTPEVIGDLVERSASDIVRMLPVALPEHGMERAAAGMKAAFMRMPMDSNVLKCHPDSVVECIIMAALTGFAPSLSPLQMAYLVPRYNKARSCHWLHYMLSHRAWMDICAQNGEGWRLRTGVAYAEDDFSYTEEPPAMRHVPNFKARNFKDSREEWGAIVAAYAAVDTPHGTTRYEVLSKYELEKRRSKAQFDNVWSEWPSPMARSKAAHAGARAGLFPLTDAAKLVSGGTLGMLTGSTQPEDFELTTTTATPAEKLLPPIIQPGTEPQEPEPPRAQALRPKAALGAMLLAIQGEDLDDEERKSEAAALLEELSGKGSVKDLDADEALHVWNVLGAHPLDADVRSWLAENEVDEAVTQAFGANEVQE